MRIAVVVVILGVLVVLGASTAGAQAGNRLTFDAYGAFVIPTGDYGESFKASPGIGAAIAYAVTPAIAIAGHFDWGMMKGKTEIGGTSVNQDIMNYFATVGYDMLAAERAMSLVGFLGGGMQVFKPKPVADAPGGDSRSYPTVNAGFKFNYWFTGTLGLMLRTGVSYAITQEEDFGMRAAINLPQAAGVSLRF